jgi:hypothetical protein
MSPRLRQAFTKISLRVGSELRISDNCELRVSNPALEIMSDDPGQVLNSEEAAGYKCEDLAALDYRFDPDTAEHVLRLLRPVKMEMP